jgi:hypothetical protein
VDKCNQLVVGSNPTPGANAQKHLYLQVFFVYFSSNPSSVKNIFILTIKYNKL